MISAIVLAAGLSTRMGQPKQLLPYGDHTVIEQVISVLLAAPVDEVLVVTGHERSAVEAVLSRWPVHVVFNPDYADQDMLSSAQAGLRAVSCASQAVLLALGDMPAIQGDVISRLIQAYHETGDDYIYIPSYRMRAGHPVLVPRSYWQTILCLPPADTLRSALRARTTRVEWVVVDTPSILRDMDTPEEYERELGAGVRTQGSGVRDRDSGLGNLVPDP
jgi:molybdenum cofactor cytidylyltransferase